jgi:triosephosphate isomerase (TIM)
MAKARPLVAGNWKMNGRKASLAELDKILAGAQKLTATVDVLVCPPATLLAAFAARAQGSRVAIGGQDCHAETAGAFTGDIAAEMLRDAGASAVIVGHSERRIAHQESDDEVKAKALAAWRAELMPIVCVGETQDERHAKATLSRLERQLNQSLPTEMRSSLVVAYEPVWAIGTGVTPSTADIAGVHAFIRKQLAARFPAGDEVRILYGGSVKATNAKELLAVDNVDGALVGGASLKADEFLAIAGVYR